MTPKQSKQWFDRLPPDVRTGVEEMYQAFAARYRGSAQGVCEEAQSQVDQWRAEHPNMVKGWRDAQLAGTGVLTVRRMTGIWRFGLPPTAKDHISFETFWTAVDKWIDQNTKAPPDKEWRVPY
jgi:hypothetical protein